MSSADDILLLRQQIASLKNQILVANENIVSMKRALAPLEEEVETERKRMFHHVNNITHMRLVADMVDLNEFATSRRYEKAAKQALADVVAQVATAKKNIATSTEFVEMSERRLARRKAALERFGQVRYLDRVK